MRHVLHSAPGVCLPAHVCSLAVRLDTLLTQSLRRALHAQPTATTAGLATHAILKDAGLALLSMPSIIPVTRVHHHVIGVPQKTHVSLMSVCPTTITIISWVPCSMQHLRLVLHVHRTVTTVKPLVHVCHWSVMMALCMTPLHRPVWGVLAVAMPVPNPIRVWPMVAIHTVASIPLLTTVCRVPVGVTFVKHLAHVYQMDARMAIPTMQHHILARAVVQAVMSVILLIRVYPLPVLEAGLMIQQHRVVCPAPPTVSTVKRPVHVYPLAVPQATLMSFIRQLNLVLRVIRRLRVVPSPQTVSLKKAVTLRAMAGGVSPTTSPLRHAFSVVQAATTAVMLTLVCPTVVPIIMGTTRRQDSVHRVHPTVIRVLMLAHACLARVMLATYMMLPQERVCHVPVGVPLVNTPTHAWPVAATLAMYTIIPRTNVMGV